MCRVYQTGWEQNATTDVKQPPKPTYTWIYVDDAQHF